MQWWCSAQNVAWSWQWQAYPGVWLFIGVLAAGYFALRRRVGAAPGNGRVGWFVAGAALLWIALDWPVGVLGAGYLASVHMGQYLIIAMLAPPLLLLGLPRAAIDAVSARPIVGPALRYLTHPLAAIVLFNVVLITTHLPGVVDRLMVTQLGSFAIDVAWLGAGLTFWWPIICPAPERAWFHDLVKIGYLIANTILNTAPFVFLAFSEFPLYATYELAPPVAGISTQGDQQLAGFMMKIGGAFVVWGAIAILFFRWARREEREDRESVRAPA